MATEQLFATRTRFFQETAIGNATPAGDVVEPRFNTVTATRISTYTEEKTTPFGHKEGRESVLEYFAIQADLHVGRYFLAFLLQLHLTGGTALDYRSPEPTFALQVETENGDLIQFDGLALADLQISFVARGITNLSISLFGLKRTAGVSLEAVTASHAADPLPGTDVVVAAKAGALDPFPQASNNADAYSAEIFFRRSLIPSQFNADGVPTRHDIGPWRIFGEVVLAAGTFPETATADFVDGSAAFFLGEFGSTLSLFFDDSVRWLSATDPIKADDFRDYRVLFEAEANTAGQILTLTNALP